MFKLFNKFSKNSKRHTLRYSEPDTKFLDGPSGSGLLTVAPVTCTLGAGATSALRCSTINDTELTNGIKQSENLAPPSPLTPNSTTSTAPLNSLPHSPDPSTTTTDTMPSKVRSPVVVRTTTTAEIMDENRFSILDANDIDIYTLPTPPKHDVNGKSDELLDSSAGTTASTATTPSNSPKTESKLNEYTETPTKNKHRNHNNNQQDDVNTIESLTDSTSTKIPSLDLDWVDEIYLEHNANETLQKSKHKKKKKHASSTKELDQLDGIPSKPSKVAETPPDDDEKVVKCLYYTLMCCDCTIS